MLTTLRTRLALTTAAFGLATLLGAGTASAAPTAAPRGPQQAQKADKLCSKLECTDAQRAQIQDIRGVAKPKLKAEREAIRALRKQIAGEYRKDRLDGARLQALHGQLDARKAAAESVRRAMLAQIHGVLTPAQRQAYFETLGQGKHKGKGKRQGKGKGKRQAKLGATRTG